jgi:hypothetical protein
VPGNEDSLGFGESDERVHGRDVRGGHAQHVADLLKLCDARASPLSVLERVPCGARLAGVRLGAGGAPPGLQCVRAFRLLRAAFETPAHSPIHFVCAKIFRRADISSASTS